MNITVNRTDVLKISEINPQTYFEYIFTNMNSEYPEIRRQSFSVFNEFLLNNDKAQFSIPEEVVSVFLQIMNEHLEDHPKIVTSILSSLYCLVYITNDKSLKTSTYSIMISNFLNQNCEISQSAFLKII
ncbi:MAG: hypothetical protein IKN39_04295, partial [Clostridia bacterium]|nr:hypothetical protein [Clostridia bacterium]